MKRRTSAYAARLRQLSPTAREALYTIALAEPHEQNTVSFMKYG